MATIFVACVETVSWLSHHRICKAGPTPRAVRQRPGLPESLSDVLTKARREQIIVKDTS